MKISFENSSKVFLWSTVNKRETGNRNFVVSESSVKQFYRTQFHLYAEEGIAEINPILFRSLEELPDECLCAKRVVCALLLSKWIRNWKTKIYPISLKGANIHLYHIAQELHLLKHISWWDLNWRPSTKLLIVCRRFYLSPDSCEDLLITSFLWNF